jgi:RHS repeat-associated protein
LTATARWTGPIQGTSIVIETDNGVPTDFPSADFDFDGDVDSLDWTELDESRSGVGTPVAVTYSALDNPYFSTLDSPPRARPVSCGATDAASQQASCQGLTGRTTDTLHADDLLVSNDGDFRRLQDNRNRMYDPKHGRWLQRDPLGVRPDAPYAPVKLPIQYKDGMSLYQYVRSNPQQLQDPDGLFSPPAVSSFCAQPVADT